MKAEFVDAAIKRFVRYGSIDDCTLEHLLEIQRTDGDLWAHAENSGSESCICEVSRWNHVARQWQRYCWIKAMDFRFPGYETENDEFTADRMASLINEAGHSRDSRACIIHRMPEWGSKRK